MLGLMYLGATVLYLLTGCMAVRWAWRRGRSDGGSVPKGAGFAVLAFFLVYLPLFWNHIPVVLAHRSMCSADAGFRIYKTPEQWLAENRDQLAAVQKGADLTKMFGSSTTGNGYQRYQYFGGLLASESRTKRERIYGVDVLRVEQLDRDVRTGTLISSLVDYQVGSRDDVRLWFAGKNCFSPGDASNPFVLSQKFHQRFREMVE